MNAGNLPLKRHSRQPGIHPDSIALAALSIGHREPTPINLPESVARGREWIAPVQATVLDYLTAKAFRSPADLRGVVVVDAGHDAPAVSYTRTLWRSTLDALADFGFVEWIHPPKTKRTTGVLRVVDYPAPADVFDPDEIRAAAERSALRAAVKRNAARRGTPVDDRWNVEGEGGAR